MSKDFSLLMISAMYENGGNFTHRLFDGHPELFVYPFESQLGTRLVQDSLSGMFPAKYRWPEFALGASAADNFTAIIDEECKVRARTPQVSKFRHVAVELDDEQRKAIFCSLLNSASPTRANYLQAFFQATHQAWENSCAPENPHVYVGYSPALIVDGEKIIADFPTAVILHVVRNPWSAYSDTKKRPVPLSLANYCTAWCINQYFALLLKQKYPDNVFIVRTEDIISDPRQTLAPITKTLGISASETLGQPSFNGAELKEVYPWGTIRKATAKQNLATAEQLAEAERDEVALRTGQYLEEFDYIDFFQVG